MLKQASLWGLAFVTILFLPLAAIAQDSSALRIASSYIGFDADPQDQTILNLHVFATVLTREPDGSITPGVVSSWQMSDDGTTVTLRVDDDAKFHDGKSVNASDVAYSIERASKRPGQQDYSSLVGLIPKVIDENTLELRAERARPDVFLALAGLPVISKSAEGLLPKEIMEKTDQLAGGPFEIAQINPFDRVLLKRFPLASMGNTSWHTITLRELKDSKQRLTEFISKDVDVLGNLTPTEYAELQGLGANIVEAKSDYVRLAQLGPSTDVFADPELRRAISLSLNRPALAAVASKYGEFRAEPANTLFHDQDASAEAPFNIAAARDIVWKRGAAGKRLGLFYFEGGDWRTAMLSEMKDALDASGFATEVTPIERDRSLAVQLAEVPNWLLVETKFLPAVDGAIEALVAPYGKENYSGWRDPDVDALIEMKASPTDLADKVQEKNLLVPLLREEHTWAAQSWLRVRPRSDGLILAQNTQVSQGACPDCKSGYRFCQSKNACVKTTEFCADWCQ
jgi:ABC-type transport system substrate-binding protein